MGEGQSAPMARDVMTIRCGSATDPCGEGIGGHDQPPRGRGRGRVDPVGVALSVVRVQDPGGA